MKQLNIFEDPCAGNHGGNENSIEAHKSVVGAKTKMHKSILGSIQLRGYQGLTVDEAEQVLNLSHQTCSARFSELKKSGLVVEFGKRKTRTGSKASVWILSSKGKNLLEVKDE